MQQRERLQSVLGSAYTLEHELGGGGMSRVFLAEERALGRKVVVKVLSPDLSAGVNAERFNREIQLAAKLQQAQIVPVLTAGQVDGISYYTMPFVDGESLRARLARDGALSIPSVINILRDVCRALAYAHEHGVVHRDIKPDNVLLSGGTAVVTDFGIAKAISAARQPSDDSTLTQLGTSIGTPAYMSPEQAAGDPGVDHRTDLYSLGCMAYELLSGQPPFAGRTLQRALAAHLTETPVPVAQHRPDVPPALAQIVMRCLEKDPAARPSSAIDIVAALDTISGSAPGMPTSTAKRGVRPLGIGRALLLYAAAFAAVVVVAKAAVVALGVPDWTFSGAVILMAAGLPLALAIAHFHSWGRAFRAGAVLLAAFVAAVAAVMVLRIFGRGPAASLLAAGTLSGRERLLVADFSAGGDSSLSHLITEAVRTNLEQSQAVSVMPPTAIAAALGRMQRPPLTAVDAPLAREIAQREGAKAIVTGGVTPLGGGYVLSIRLVAADSGNELAAFRNTVNAPNQLLDAIDELTRKLRGRIGESLKAVRDAPALDAVTTTSLDALRKYAEANRAFDLGGDYARASGLLREAIAFDSTFAMAYRKLGVALLNNGMPRPQIDSALSLAFRYSARLPEKERYLTIGSYYESGPGRNRRLAREAFRRALSVDSLDPTALNNLANNLRQIRQFARAESLYHVLAMSPRVPQVSLSNWAGTLFMMGRLATSESVYSEVRRRFPAARAGQAYPPLFMYQRGQLDSAEGYWRAYRSDASPAVRLPALGNLTTFAVLRGRFRDLPPLVREARALNAARGVPPNPLGDSLDGAGLAIAYLDRPEEGIHMLETGLAATPLSSLPFEQRPYFAIATYYAWAKHPDRARAVLAQLDAAMPDSTYRTQMEPRRHYVLGEIALAEGRPLDAVREFWRSDSLPDGPTSDCAFCIDIHVGRAYDLANLPDSAIAHWERYVAGVYPGRHGFDSQYIAMVRRRLGELYDQRGDTQRAAANYLAFVELWKNADPELQPKVQEVRRRIARLRETAGK